MSLDLSQCSDGELAALARTGRTDIYGEFLVRYKAPVFRLIRSNVIDEDEAMDLTQETFVALMELSDPLAQLNVARYAGEQPFRPWISRIAINNCRDWARRRAVRSFFTRALPLESARDLASDGPAPDVEAGDRAELARVRAAMAALPHNLREVLVLRGVEDLSQAETAALLRISEKTVETRLYRARAKLRMLLEADGV